MAGTGKIVALVKALAPGVDPSVIEQAVTDWLDDHPEATTTVEDGSITEEKLASDVLADLAEIEELKEAIGNVPSGSTVEGQISDLKSALNRQSAYIRSLNLLDTESLVSGLLNTSGGISANTSFFTTDYIPIEGQQDLVFQAETSDISTTTDTIYFFEYDSSHTKIGSRQSFTINRGDKSNTFATSSENAAYIRVSYVVAKYTGVMIHLGTTVIDYEPYYILKSEIAKSVDVLNLQNQVNGKAELPHLHEYVSYTETRGITKKDLTVYDEGAEYMGRTTHISVTPGEVYLISGRSTSANYPCAQYVNSSNVVTELLGGSSVTYSNERVTIPEGAVTLYINGSTSIPIGIVKIVQMTQDELDSYFSNEQSQNCPLKALYKNGVLSVKRKHDATHDIVLTFGNVGGNSLFNFRSAYYIANSDDYPSDSFDEASATAVWTMSGTDWLGPYTVAANQNADGDAPTDVYFTGGNHRTTNTGTGGGVTAVQNSLSILIDGNKAIQENIVMPCRFVAAKWQNTVQAYNTSKANGSGRGVLTENWVMEITEKDVKVHNTITALENITLKTYYGLQASCSGKNYRYIGGENRGVYAIGTDTINSGNNTCRTVELSDTNFILDITIEPIDLGLFENNKGWSFFPSSTKMYAYLVAPDHEIVIATGEKYDVFGWYEFK